MIISCFRSALTAIVFTLAAVTCLAADKVELCPLSEVRVAPSSVFAPGGLAGGVFDVRLLAD